MRNRLMLALVMPAAVLAAACGRGDAERDIALSNDLQSDLELASAAGVQLASSARDFSANQVVSGIESVPRGTSAPGATAPRPRARPRATPQPVAVAAPEAEYDEAPSVEAEAPAPAEVAAAADAESPSEEPEVVVAPQAGADPGQGNTGGGWGDIIGVVIRGGAVGVDDCPRHPGGGVIVGTRFPNPGGVVYGGYGGRYGGGTVRRPSSGDRSRVGSIPRSRGPSSFPAPSPGGRTTGRTRM